MSKLPPDKGILDQYRVYTRYLSLNSPRQTMIYNTFNTTKCCNEHDPLYIKCVSKFSHVMDVLYNFDASTYVDDENMPLY